MKKKYDEARVVSLLRRNPGIKIQGNVIRVNNSLNTIGNGSWGKIDFLVHYCGYSTIRDISKITPKSETKTEDNPNKRFVKFEKRNQREPARRGSDVVKQTRK